MTEGAFFRDLAVLMTAAGFVAVLFTRLKWPKVIGYLLAGILMSRHTWGGAFLADEASITSMGQLGIVFLMFTIGLEFSTRDFNRVKHVSVPTAVFDTVVMVWLGYAAGRSLFGWGMVPSLFLGAALCDSSTTLMAKVIEEMNWGRRAFAKYGVGIAIFEDILCVGVIALITGVAHGTGLSLGAVGWSLGAFALFFVCTLLVGFVLVPRLLDSVGALKNDEALLLTLLGCCFFVSYIAYTYNFSIALGSFLVGILGASSHVRDRLYALTRPLKDMFVAVFFVTIGCLVDPITCFHHLPAILLLTLVVILGKGFNTFALSLVTGLPVKTAVQIGFSLAQIGEFGYMVALLYVVETHDASSPMCQIVVGVSLLATFLNPILLRAGDPVGDWLEHRLPARITGALSAYHDWLARYQSSRVPSALRARVRTRIVWLSSIGILDFAAGIVSTALVSFNYRRFSVFFDDHKRTFFCLALNLFCLIMLAPLSRVAHSLGRDIAHILLGDQAHRDWRAAVQEIVIFAIRLIVLSLFFAQIVMLNANLLPDDRYVRLALFVILLLTGLLGWKRFTRAGRVVGARFASALAAEKEDRTTRAETILSVPADFHGVTTLAAASPAVGHSIKELDVRARTGASIVSIVRGGVKYRNPGPDWRFVAADAISVIGEPEQLRAFRALMEKGSPV